MSEPLMFIKNLYVALRENHDVHVINGVSFHVGRGEILGIVGESGCGKSVTALSIKGLLNPALEVIEGNIMYGDKDLLTLSDKERQRTVADKITMIYQEPMNALNPLMKIEKQIAEILKLQKKYTKEEIHEKIVTVLDEVGIHDPEAVCKLYPHQLSGGMQQRVIIAMALIGEPDLIIADEPTTALDVTTQAEILKLMKEINQKYNTSIIIISHDLGVIKEISDRILVMYRGKVAERGKTGTIIHEPAHEYTKGLMKAIPTRNMKGKPLFSIKGRIPTVYEEKVGCPFAPRCEKATEECFTTNPENYNLGERHLVRCNQYKGQGSTVDDKKEQAAEEAAKQKTILTEKKNDEKKGEK